MATYVLIHGAGDVGWAWHLVEAELRELGHDVVVPDLPCEDDAAGLTEYADTVIDAIGDRTDLVVVGHSFGGFTAPIVCDRVPVDLLVLVAAMIPLPGEAPGDWWSNTGWEETRHEQDERDGKAPDDDIALFLHDVPPDLAAEALKRGRDQSGTPLREPWPLTGWPDVSTNILICRDDRFFPDGFMRRVVRERLGITPDEMDGGHCSSLGRPRELVDHLERYRAERTSDAAA